MTSEIKKFSLDPSLQVLLADLGVSPQDLLRQAHLPLDLFSQPSSTLTTLEYFRLWQGLEFLLSNDQAFPLRVAQTATVEAFSPPLFACICSANLNQALKRLAQYKPLISPLKLDVVKTDQQTQVTLVELHGQPPLPQSLIATELAFFVHLARLTTRNHIIPLAIQSNVSIPAAKQFETFFGCPLTGGQINAVTFSAVDAQRPFLTSNAGMWSIFEPELQKRMKHLERGDQFRDRVQACLMEILASGQCSMAETAQKLAVSPRTLQRRLREEGTSFQQELSHLRAELAHYYLVNTPYSSAEIAFLLGYGDPSSFFRAFHLWTGKTPDVVREVSQL